MDKKIRFVSLCACGNNLGHGVFVCNPDLPHRQLHFPLAIAVVYRHNAPVAAKEPAVADKLVICLKLFDRTFPQRRASLVEGDHISVKFDQIQIFLPPGVRPAVIRVCPPAQAGFVSVIHGRSAGPCHLDEHGFPKDTLVDASVRRLRPSRIDAAHGPVCPGKEPAVVVIGQLVHGDLH